MVHLFAVLPAVERENIQAERIHDYRGFRSRNSAVNNLYDVVVAF
ncbi:hypothetical protein HanXRQr2_Chr09g0367901 [Helianthus annuus]|uniref:Uncharacterized protein n=1 Tax=Helianthus annuus TaxID=4232 RepID=A0A9K3I2C2_HELAN|nr:hypothetical protein HanXRQr2_Chr09g0367901 [Helianthus annuus]KAJ0891480.1 hypothetical protein HanPSC8_Chr09g0354331 [Helianthus annuus]